MHRKPVSKNSFLPKSIGCPDQSNSEHTCHQIFFLFLNWNITDRELYLGFRYTTYWSNICKYCEIITITSLHILKNFYIMMSTFKTCFLRNFQICSAVLLTVVTMLSMTPPWLIFFIAGSLHPLTPFTHFTQSPHPHHWQPSQFSVSLSFFSLIVCISGI